MLWDMNKIILFWLPTIMTRCRKKWVMGKWKLQVSWNHLLWLFLILILFMVASSFCYFSRFYTNSNKSFILFFTKITFLFCWFIKLFHWHNYLKNNIVLLKWVNFDNIFIIFTCGTFSCLMPYIIYYPLQWNAVQSLYNRLLCSSIYIWGRYCKNYGCVSI